MGLAFEVVVAHEPRGRQVRQNGQVPSQTQVVGLHGGSGPGPLGVQLLLEARQVGDDPALPAPVFHQVHGEPVGVVKPENV